MKRLVKGMICSICLITLLTGCGKAEGDSEVVKSVKDGTYVATETIATNSDSDKVVKTNWTVKPTLIKDCDKGIKELVKDVDKDIYIDRYIGYIVQENNIKYAFTGLTEQNEKRLVYVIQDATNNSIKYEYPDYSEINDIYISEIVTNTDATTD